MKEIDGLKVENFTLDFEMNNTVIEAFLELIRCGIRDKQPQNKYFEKLTQQDWFLIFNMIKMQSVVGVCLQPALDLPLELRPPRQLLLQWGAYRNYVRAQNEKIRAVWSRLRDLFAEVNIHPIVLKGISVGSCYAHPDYRQAGDIDLYFPEKYKEGIQQLIKHDIKISYSEEHDKIHIDDVLIELHHRYANIPFEIVFPHSSRIIQTEGTEVTALDINTEALLLLLHPAKHLFANGIGIRHLCDWTMFLEKYKDKIDTELVLNEVKRLGLYQFVRCFTYLSSKHLGLQIEKDSPWIQNAIQPLADYMFKDMIIRGDCGSIADEMRRKWFPYYIKSTIRAFKLYRCWPPLFWKRIPHKMYRRFGGILLGRPYGVHTHKYKK